MLEEIEAAEEELADAASDVHVQQPLPTRSSAEGKFFPFGRDEVVPTAAERLAIPPPASRRTDSFDAMGLLSDVDEGNDDLHALRVEDEEVPVRPPVATEVAGLAGLSGGDDGIMSELFPDDIAQQGTRESAPRGHRQHTDYDLQGFAPDLLVPAPQYDSALGEDLAPAGLEDAAVRVGRVHETAAAPDPFEGLVPDQWLDSVVNVGDGSGEGVRGAGGGEGGGGGAGGWAEGVDRLLWQAGVDLRDVRSHDALPPPALFQPSPGGVRPAPAPAPASGSLIRVSPSVSPLAADAPATAVGGNRTAAAANTTVSGSGV